MTRRFCIFFCFIFIVSLPCFAAASSETEGELVRIVGGTTICNDADLARPVGVLPFDAVVYANEASVSSAGEVIEIIYCRDFIVRYGFVPLTLAEPLTPEEKAEYAEDSADGILILPGISLMNIELSVLPSAAGSSVDADGLLPEPEHTEETALPFGDSDPTPNTVPAPAPAEVLPSDAASSRMAGSMAMLPRGTPLYADAELSDVLGWLAQDAYVYVNADLTSSAGSVMEVVYCRDYIIRYAYVSPSAAYLPEDAGDGNALPEDGITYKPGAILSNTILTDTPTASGVPSGTPASSSVSSVEPPVEAAAPAPETPAGVSGGIDTENDADETPASPSLPSEEQSAPEGPIHPSPSVSGPENAVTGSPSEETAAVSQYDGVRLKAVPTGKYYLLNPSDPVPAGSVIRSVTLFPMSTGYAEGMILLLSVSDGKCQVLFSKDFTATVPYASPWETVIPLDAVCETDVVLAVRFGTACIARFGMTASENGSLVYLNALTDDPVMLTTAGYSVNYQISFE